MDFLSAVNNIMQPLSLLTQNSSSSGGAVNSALHKIQNLNTSDNAAFNEIIKLSSDANLSPLQQTMVQKAYQQRLQITGLMSNLLKAFFDTMRQIANNIRV